MDVITHRCSVCGTVAAVRYLRFWVGRCCGDFLMATDTGGTATTTAVSSRSCGACVDLGDTSPGTTDLVPRCDELSRALATVTSAAGHSQANTAR